MDSNLLLEPPYLSPRPAPHLVAVGTANPVRGRRGIPDLLPHRLARGSCSARKAPAISMKSDPWTPWPASLLPKSNSPSALRGGGSCGPLAGARGGRAATWPGDGVTFSSLPACLPSSPPLPGRESRYPGLGGSPPTGFLPCFRGLSERMSHLGAVATPAVQEPRPPYLGCKRSGCQWGGAGTGHGQSAAPQPPARCQGCGQKG